MAKPKLNPLGQMMLDRFKNKNKMMLDALNNEDWIRCRDIEVQLGELEHLWGWMLNANLLYNRVNDGVDGDCLSDMVDMVCHKDGGLVKADLEPLMHSPEEVWDKVNKVIEKEDNRNSWEYMVDMNYNDPTLLKIKD